MLTLIRHGFSSFKFRSLFFRILIILLFLVIIPVTMIGLAGNWYSQSAIQREVERSSVQMLEQTRRLMDVLLNDIDSWTVQLAQSDALNNLMASDDPASRDRDVDSVHADLLDLYVNSPYVKSVYVYYAGQRIVQGPLVGFVPLEQTGDPELIRLVDSGMSREGKWFTSGSSVSSSDPFSGSSSDSSGGSSGGSSSESAGAEGNAPQVTLMRTVPLLNDSVRGAIIVNLDQTALFQSPSLRLMREGEEIWMVSPDGRFAFNNRTGQGVDRSEFSNIGRRLGGGAASFVQPFRGGDYAFNVVESPYTKWKYVDVIPVDTLHANSSRVRSVMLLLAGLSCAVAVVLAFFATVKIYSPIYSLFRLSSGRKRAGGGSVSGKSELDYLAYTIRHMDEEASSLESRLRDHMPVLQASFLHTLLREAADPKETADKLAYYGLQADPYGFYTFALRIDDPEAFAAKYSGHDQSLVRYFIAKLAEEVLAEFGMRGYPVYAESRDLIVIGNLKSEAQRAEFRELATGAAERLLGLVEEYLQLSVSVGIGDLRQDPGKISESYAETMKALEIRAFHGSHSIVAIWTDRPEHSEGLSMFDRLKEVRQMLMTDLKEESGRSASETAQVLHRLAVSSKGVHFVLLQHAFFQLLIDIYSHAVDLGMPAESEGELTRMHEELTRQDTAEKLASFVALQAADIKTKLIAKWDRWKHPVVNRIVEYIDANYGEDISLGDIADRLQLDPAYVSRLFKQHSSVNFMDYLISLRMAKAKEMLAGGDAPIKDIGAAVGYANPRSFNRIFKKCEGVTPGEYREAQLPAKLHPNRVY